MRKMQNLGGVTALLVFLLWASVARGSVSFHIVVNFNGTNGADPKGGLTLGQDGNLYGTTVEGGTNNAGTVFRLSADGVFDTIYTFTGAADGANPSAALAEGRDGNLYGTAYNGGISNAGTIFQITPAGDFALLASFSGTNGANPDAALVQAEDGSWYGATDDGGPFTNLEYQAQNLTGYGVIFRVTTNGELTNPFQFANTNGARPNTLALGPDGAFYGTTAWGGPYLRGSPFSLGFGTIYSLTTNGVMRTLYNFTGGADGGWPYAGLLLAQDGNLYGVTFSGGAQFYGQGAFFRITPAGAYTNLHPFAVSDGADPNAGLIQGPDGKLYGTTYGGGTSNLGTVFQITTNGAVRTLHGFVGSDGSYPLGSLVQGTDGNFYGVTPSGGTYGKGVLFRVSIPLPPTVISVASTPTGVTVVWTAVLSQRYQLQYTTSLSQPNWIDLDSTLTATSGVLQATDASPTDPQRWYRILLLP